MYKCISVFAFLIAMQTYGQNKSPYERLYGFQNGFARVEKEGLFGFVDTNLKEVIPCSYPWLNNFNSVSGLASFTDNNRLFGYLNKNGKVVAEPKYEWVYFFDEHTQWVYVKRGGKYGFMDKNGKEVIPCIYDKTNRSAETIHRGMIRMKKNGKYGVINKSGEVLIKFEYDSFQGFNNTKGFPYPFLVAIKGDRYFVIDIRTFERTETNFDYVGEFHQGIATILQNDKWGYIDTSLSILIACQYKVCRAFNNGLAIVTGFYGKQGMINSLGETVINLKYDGISNFNGGLASVRLNNTGVVGYRADASYGFINKKGKEVIKVAYKSPSMTNDEFTYKHISLCMDSTYFLVNKKGRRKSKYEYSSIGFVDRFRWYTDIKIGSDNNYCQGKRNNLFYALNKKAKEVNKMGSQEMIFFNEELAMIHDSNNCVGFINPKGKVVIPFIYDYYWYYHFLKGYSILKFDGKLGMIDSLGNIVIPFEYQKLQHFSNGYALGKKENKYVLLNVKNEVVFHAE